MDELVYGRSLKSPLRMLREWWEELGDDPTEVEYFLNLGGCLLRAQDAVGENMLAQKSAKRYYDKGARSCKFEVN